MTPTCECHDVPMLWHKNARKEAGGYWCCRKAARAHSRAYRQRNLEVIRAQQRDQKRHRYDTDPIYRITRNLSRAADYRAQALEGQRNRLEELRGEV